MNIDSLTIGQARELAQMFSGNTEVRHPVWDGPVVAQFIGRFVFVCNLAVSEGYCYLTNVRNVRMWKPREDGLGGLAKDGPKEGDKIDRWPDQRIPIDKLGPVMKAEGWK